MHGKKLADRNKRAARVRYVVSQRQMGRLALINLDDADDEPPEVGIEDVDRRLKRRIDAMLTPDSSTKTCSEAGVSCAGTAVRAWRLRSLGQRASSAVAAM